MEENYEFLKVNSLRRLKLLRVLNSGKLGQHQVFSDWLILSAVIRFPSKLFRLQVLWCWNFQNLGMNYDHVKYSTSRFGELSPFWARPEQKTEMIFREMRIITLLKGKTRGCGNLLSFAFICKEDIVATIGFTPLSTQNIALA